MWKTITITALVRSEWIQKTFLVESEHDFCRKVRQFEEETGCVKWYRS